MLAGPFARRVVSGRIVVAASVIALTSLGLCLVSPQVGRCQLYSDDSTSPDFANTQSCNTRCQEQQTDCALKCDQDETCIRMCRFAAEDCVKRCLAAAADAGTPMEVDAGRRASTPGG